MSSGVGEFDRAIAGTRHAFRVEVEVAPVDDVEEDNEEYDGVSSSVIVKGNHTIALDTRMIDEELAARAVAGKRLTFGEEIASSEVAAALVQGVVSGLSHFFCFFDLIVFSMQLRFLRFWYI